MTCPTCDHTMQCVSTALSIHWCPRCGTLRLGTGTERNYDDVPKLVARVVEFGSTLSDGVLDGESVISDFERLGLREATCIEA